MAFESIPTIEDAQFYLDMAFRRAKNTAQRGRINLREKKEEKSRKIEMSRISTVKDILNGKLSNIIDEFPSLDSLTPFYNELVKLSMDYVQVKKSLGSVNWAAKQVNLLSGRYLNKIKDAGTIREMNTARKEYYGRVSSILEEIDADLKVLMSARKEFVSFPVIKDLPTVCITGFPNVGKTTLLSKLTGSTPDIRAYAFTTKRLNLGYDTIDDEKVQFIDTPGTLARENKMNIIEKQAYLAMKTAADVLIYVWDLTEPFSLEDQKKLFRIVKKYDKPVIQFISKTDIVPESKVNDFKTEEMVIGIDGLKEKVNEIISS